MKKIFLLISISTFCFAACQNTARESRRFSAYYDIDSLIDNQLISLAAMGARIDKVAQLNNRIDSTTYNADSAQLAHEFNVFRKANINKPALEGEYEKTIGQDGNLNTISYSPAENGSDLEVKLLKLTYNGEMLVKLEAVIEEDHWLYNSQRQLNFNLSRHNDLIYINKYTIHGSQKMILRDRVNFTISGRIIPQAL